MTGNGRRNVGHQPDDRVAGFGTSLREIRKAQGITQKWLSEKAGLAIDEISRIENGRQPGMRLSTALRVVDGLNACLGSRWYILSDLLNEAPDEDEGW